MLVDINEPIESTFVDKALSNQERFNPRYTLGQCLVVLRRTIAAVIGVGRCLVMMIVVVLAHTCY